MASGNLAVAGQDTGAASGRLQALQRVGDAVGLALLVAVAASADGHADQAARVYQLTTLFAALALGIAVLVIKPSPRDNTD